MSAAKNRSRQDAEPKVSVLKKVMLAGEGSNELGTRANVYPASEHRPGVIEAFCQRMAGDTFAVTHAANWKSIRKYRSGNHLGAEARTILGLALQAKEAHVDALIFCRDHDWQDERVHDIHEGIAALEATFPDFHSRVAGGVATPMLEAWVLASAGVSGTEEMRRSKLAASLKEKGVELDEKRTSALLELIPERIETHELPADAHSLRGWLEKLQSVLSE